MKEVKFDNFLKIISDGKYLDIEKLGFDKWGKWFENLRFVFLPIKTIKNLISSK